MHCTFHYLRWHTLSTHWNQHVVLGNLWMEEEAGGFMGGYSALALCQTFLSGLSNRLRTLNVSLTISCFHTPSSSTKDHNDFTIPSHCARPSASGLRNPSSRTDLNIKHPLESKQSSRLNPCNSNLWYFTTTACTYTKRIALRV